MAKMTDDQQDAFEDFLDSKITSYFDEMGIDFEECLPQIVEVLQDLMEVYSEE